MILIRSCHGHDELEACVQMQIDTWGYDPTDVIPRKAFLVMQKVGGQVIGAFDTELPGASAEGDSRSLIGFAMSLPGMKTGDGSPKAYLHSHMLGCGRSIAIAGWARNSSGNNDVRLWGGALG